MLTINEDEITIADIDEAIINIKALLVDKYGNRLTHHQRELLKSSIDDLLDARLSITLKLREEGN